MEVESLWYLTDPDKIVRPHDFTYNPDDADLDKEGGIGGRIVRTEFNPGYTLVIISEFWTKKMPFFKSKEELLKEVISLKELEPWKVYEFSGHPHKNRQAEILCHKRVVLWYCSLPQVYIMTF